jgi:hypothetical protein
MPVEADIFWWAAILLSEAFYTGTQILSQVLRLYRFKGRLVLIEILDKTPTRCHVGANGFGRITLLFEVGIKPLFP